MSATGELTFNASDGWVLGGVLRAPSKTPAPAAVMVPGSLHERDAWSTVADELASRGVASLCLDVRGRGASRGALTWARMGPGERRRVTEDVRAALELTAAHDMVDGDRLVIVTEQDTSSLAMAGTIGDQRLRGAVVVSGRGPEGLVTALTGRHLPVLGLVSTEDRRGLRATVDAYLAGAETGSRIEIFRGLGIGITMGSVRQFEQPDEQPIEVMIAEWVADRLD